MLRSHRLGSVAVRHCHKSADALGRVAMLAALVATLISLFGPVANAQDDEAWAPPTRVWVEVTGQIVDQTFLSTWRSYKMLIGEPISGEFQDRVTLDGVRTDERSVQYYQNVALVASYDDPRGNDWNIRALPLGAEALKLDASKLKKENVPAKGDCDDFTAEECLYFSSTKHTVKLGFKGYWEVNLGEQLLGAPLTEEFVGKDGWTIQYFENGILRWNEEEGIVPRPLGTEAARREGVRTLAVSQPEDVPTYAESLFYEPVVVTTPIGPGPQQGGYKEIVVSISEQYLWAYEGGLTVVETYVSTGTAESIEVTTPVGYWSILTKYDIETMEGTVSDEYYLVEDVPWVMYFDNLGNALHGTYWHNNFGYPMSHGCVNLPLDVAEWMYSWADLGTPVTVVA